MGTEFRLLASVTVMTKGRVIDIGSARQQCVLVALLVDVNHVVHANQLIERVWGVGAPSGAKGALLQLPVPVATTSYRRRVLLSS